MITGAVERTNGFAALSHSMVVGTVGPLVMSCCWLHSIICFSSLFSGSTDSEKWRFVIVYSCPTNTRVWSGRGRSLEALYRQLLFEAKEEDAKEAAALTSPPTWPERRLRRRR